MEWSRQETLHSSRPSELPLSAAQQSASGCRDLDDGGANSSRPFVLLLSIQQMGGTRGVFRPGIRDRSGLRCHSSCDSPCGRGHRLGCGRRRDVLPDVRCLAACLLHSLPMAQRELQLETKH